jgi:alpha-mannosidase
MHNYAPVLGKFITFSDFFQRTDSPTRHNSPKPGEYLTPYLFQSAAREEEDGISRFTDHVWRRARFDAGAWLAGMRRLLAGRSPEWSATAPLEREVELLGERPGAGATAQVDTKLDQFVSGSADSLARLIVNGAPQTAGYLVFNTLGFRRVVSVPLDSKGPVPCPAAEKSWVQWGGSHHSLTVDVPGAGFVWVPAESPGAPPSTNTAAPLAAPDLLRNEFFEVHLNASTGGIAQIKGYGRSPNRLSQQLNYRFSRERTVTVGEGDKAEQIKTHYAEMRRQTSAVTCAGPALGEIVTTGQIVDQTNSAVLSGFRQTVRLWRGRPVVEIEIELDVGQMPDAEPWHNYYTARFAWHDESASLTRSAMMGAQETAEERIESLHYLEIATPEQRTTILAPGLAFYRKTGARMIDSLLVVPRETERKFRFTIAVDQDYPMQSALDALTPAVVVPVSAGPPRSGSAGWFFHLGTRQVQIVQMLALAAETADLSPAEAAQPVSPPTGCGCALRLVETEGRPVRARLRCFRTPRRARQRDFRGKTVCELAIDGDAVLVDLASFEIGDIEIRFD